MAIGIEEWARQQSPSGGIDRNPYFDGEGYFNNTAMLQSAYDNAMAQQQPVTTPNNPNMPATYANQYVAPNQFGDLDQANLFGANQAQGLYGQGPQTPSFGNTTQQAQSMVQNQVNQGNPWIDNALSTTNNQLSQNNPFMQGFQNFGNQQNTAFEGTVNNALDNVTDRVNSQFGMAGRTNSGAHGGYMADALGNMANQMYSDNFQQNQNRNLSAMNAGAGLYNTDQNQQLQAASMLPGLANSRFDDAAMLGRVGADQDSMQQQQDNSGWNNLQNYMNIVQGTRPGAPEQQGPSAWDKIGALTPLLGLL